MLALLALAAGCETPISHVTSGGDDPDAGAPAVGSSSEALTFRRFEPIDPPQIDQYLVEDPLWRCNRLPRPAGGWVTHCSCVDGYERPPGATRCVDVDECASGEILCTSNRACVNTRGSYRCDPIPCGPRGTECDINATCVSNGASGTRCQCNSAYEGDGYSCTDIDECRRGLCWNRSCTEWVGGYSCGGCLEGFVEIGGVCQRPPPRVSETMTDRCSGDVIISTNYDAPAPTTDWGMIYRLVRDPATGWSPDWSEPIAISGHTWIRWWCNSTAGNWADPGTWRLTDTHIGVACDADWETGGGPHDCESDEDFEFDGIASSDVSGFTPERSRCDSSSTRAIRARLGPDRLLQIQCLE